MHRNKSEDINIFFIKTDKRYENSKVTEQCDSVFTSLNFSRANIVIFASIIYIIPYLIVLVYFAVSAIDTRAYHKAVLWYNITQIILNGILIAIGTGVLSHVSTHSNVYIILGLVLMFLTISLDYVTSFNITDQCESAARKKEMFNVRQLNLGKFVTTNNFSLCRRTDSVISQIVSYQTKFQ